LKLKEFVKSERKRYFLLSFNQIDEDGDRSITETELNEFLKLVCTPQEVHEIFVDADVNGDGLISFEGLLENIYFGNTKELISNTDSIQKSEIYAVLYA